MNTRTGTVLDLQALPEGCLANIISLTTPQDACRLSSVSKFFRSAAESDVVWDKFLPPDVYTILLQSELMQQQSSSSLSWIKTKKRLYLFLCDNPIVYNDRVFALDKRSGKKCYMIPARALKILGSGTPHLWRWMSLPADSRLTERTYGFKSHPVKVKVAKYFELTPTTVGVAAKEQTMYVFGSRKKEIMHTGIAFSICKNHSRMKSMKLYIQLKERMAGWRLSWVSSLMKEIIRSCTLEMSCVEDSFDDFKSGLIVGGIEMRPHFGERPNPRQKRQFSWGRFWNKAQSYSSLVLFGVTLLMVVLQQHLLVVFLFALSVFSSYYEKLASN